MSHSRAYRSSAVWTGASLVLLLSVSCRQPHAASFIKTNAPLIAITHVRIIDGTGSPARDDQIVVIQDGRIREVADASSRNTPEAAHVVDGSGATLIPGLVGMHEHLFYQTNEVAVPAQAAFARLYLASGVTTIRTAGTINFASDRRIKEQIDSGRLPGPKVHLTGPYLHARSAEPDPAAIAREVVLQAEQGATSFKAYMSLRSSELRAAIETAHARGLRITGHLCAVGFREAAAMGIDNLEHGLAADTELYFEKQADVCPNPWTSMAHLARLDVRTDARIQQIIADLVRHGVTVTSTLAIYETFVGDESAADPRMPGVLAWWLRKPYETARARWMGPDNAWSSVMAAMLGREMEFERAFVAAGGRLVAGADPTGWGGLVAGFGDQRQLELLVEAGLTPEMAIRVATANGADFLNEGDRVGTIEVGRQADLVLVRGNPAVRISDVRNVELVFKDGVGYDPAGLIAASQGAVGRYDGRQVFRWPLNLILIGLITFLMSRVLLRRLRRRPAAIPATVPSEA